MLKILQICLEEECQENSINNMPENAIEMKGLQSCESFYYIYNIDHEKEIKKFVENNFTFFVIQTIQEYAEEQIEEMKVYSKFNECSLEIIDLRDIKMKTEDQIKILNSESPENAIFDYYNELSKNQLKKELIEMLNDVEKY